MRRQQDQLLNLRLLEEIERETFASKSTELRDRAAQLQINIDAHDKHRAEIGEVAVKAFELSQTLKEKWLTADYRAKRRLLEIVCLNLKLVGASLVATWRKPFDVLAEQAVSENSRADRRFSIPNELVRPPLFQRVIAGSLPFTAEQYFAASS